MKNLAFLLLALLIFAAPQAEARERRETFFGGVGLSRALLDFTDGKARTTYTGWGPDLEVGFEFPLKGEFGWQFAAIGSRHELLNSIDSKTYAEKGILDSLGARVGVYYMNISLGGGMKQTRLEVTSIPSLPDQSTTVLKGSNAFGYGAFSFDYRGMFRATAEGQYTNGNFDGRTLEAYQIGMRLTLLFDL